MIDGLFYQEDITTPCKYTPNNRTYKYMRKTPIDLKKQIDKLTIIFGVVKTTSQ